MNLLSIIIPVYKVENYIAKCIDSILFQSYKNWELILVDDGSPDASGVICDDYAKRDNRIRVVHNNNGGVSSARNAGIEIASGDYLSFVDADDWIDPTMYSKMVAKGVDCDADYVICGFEEIRGKKKNEVLFSLPNNTVLYRDDIVNKLLGSIFTEEIIINSPCNKLYKRDLLIKNGIRFPKRRRGEDWLFNIRYLEVSQSAIYIDEPLYKYLRNDSSAMSKCFPEQYELWKENRLIRKEIADRYHLNVDWKETNKYFLLGAIPWTISMYKQSKDFSLNTVLDDDVFTEACKNSYHLDSLRTEIIRKMISISLPGVARLLCKI